jgi:hypothetical protein
MASDVSTSIYIKAEPSIFARGPSQTYTRSRLENDLMGHRHGHGGLNLSRCHGAIDGLSRYFWPLKRISALHDLTPADGFMGPLLKSHLHFYQITINNDYSSLFYNYL